MFLQDLDTTQNNTEDWLKQCKTKDSAYRQHKTQQYRTDTQNTQYRESSADQYKV